MEEAIKTGNLHLLEKSFNNTFSHDTILFYVETSIMYGHLNIVKFLIEKLNFLDTGMPLSNACYYSHLHIIQYLINYGYNVNKGYYVYTPLGNACSVNNLEIVKYLIENKAEYNQSSLIIACNYGNLDIVKYLLQMDYTLFTLYNKTAIQNSCQYNQPHIVKYLLLKGGNPEAIHKKYALKYFKPHNIDNILRLYTLHFNNIKLHSIKDKHINTIEDKFQLLNENLLLVSRNKDIQNIVKEYIT